MTNANEPKLGFDVAPLERAFHEEAFEVAHHMTNKDYAAWGARWQFERMAAEVERLKRFIELLEMKCPPYDAIRTENARLRKALEVYANKDRYNEHGGISIGAHSTLRSDRGETARAALAGEGYFKIAQLRIDAT